jgi:murein DD-endopeptidase MepM/ murein hydrolase activator NlpD
VQGKRSVKVRSGDRWRRRGLVLVLGVVLLSSAVVAATPPSASAIDATWTNALNGNARPVALNTTEYNLHFPVAGTSFVASPTSSADDFCYSRTYANAQCISGTGHSGNDIFPAHGGAMNGDLWVVAAYPGTVVASGCADGEGYRIYIEGDDGRMYRYLHMHGLSLMVGVNARVRVGQRLGTMSSSGSCSAYDAGLHLHFDLLKSPWSRSFDSLDPYRSLRRAYARPGLRSDGVTPDDAIGNRWLAALNTYPNYVEGIRQVGFPTGGGLYAFGVGSPNVLPSNSSTGAAGRRQFLNNGMVGSMDALSRTSAIARKNTSAVAYWVSGPFFLVWSNAGLEGSFLGWPIGDRAAGRQNFEGGCIRQTSPTSWQAFVYGQGGC